MKRNILDKKKVYFMIGLENVILENINKLIS